MVKLSVSKTELLGSNPSSPASLSALYLSAKRSLYHRQLLSNELMKAALWPRPLQ